VREQPANLRDSRLAHRIENRQIGGSLGAQGIMQDSVNIDPVKRKLKFDYMKIRNDPASRTADVFSSLLAHFQRPQIVVRDLIQEAANLIQKQFRLRWTMIGLRSQSDGLYRYEVQIGMRAEAWAHQKSRVYKESDFDMKGAYKAAEISKLSRFYAEEDNPLFKEDEQVVNRPVLLRAKRKDEDEVLEADFIDSLILGPGDDLLGWIEYGGTVAGKLPEPTTIRNIEVVAAILGAAITMQSRRLQQ
jgi:hypothetical protein